MRQIKVIKSGAVIDHPAPIEVKRPVIISDIRRNWLRDARESIAKRHSIDLQAFFGSNDAMRHSV